MSLRTVRLACCLFALTLLAAHPARADNGALFPAQAAIPNSRVIHFTSAIDGEPYTLQISIPWFAPPKAGYPVIYALDGELYFPGFAILSDLLGEKGAVVVGIGHNTLNDKAVVARYGDRKPGQVMDGYAASAAFSHLRNQDFRWPAKPQNRAPDFIQAIVGRDTGDLDQFLKVVEKEIKPRVSALVTIDKANQVLFGHSAGGLAVVHALFTEPNAFRSFIAISPALWYDGGAVLADEKIFDAAVSKGLVAPRILIATGAKETDDMALPKSLIADLPSAQRAPALVFSRLRATWPGMHSGARDLAARLKALPGKPGYQVDYALIADEDHTPAPFAAVPRIMRFAFDAK
jgi:predicted alpha/beta superfamily hydrolase